MSNRKTLTFVVILCFTCALILAVLATSLRGAQERARQLDTAKQILAAAKIYNPKGYFEIDGIPAIYDPQTELLVPGEAKATAAEIYAVSQTRLKPMLTNNQGDLLTFEEAGINRDDYVSENEATGYSQLPEKLLYLILSNTEERTIEGYVIPVNGYGLWGPIYGYLALALNADTVIGISWFAPAETPGLGAVIQDAWWQAQFTGKEIFLPGIDLAQAPLGITVVKGKVSDIFGDTPRAETAVDGITGATITGNGVTAAYKDSLAPYRPFLIKRSEK